MPRTTMCSAAPNRLCYHDPAINGAYWTNAIVMSLNPQVPFDSRSMTFVNGSDSVSYVVDGSYKSLTMTVGVPDICQY
jgi:hypothetical protein